MRTLFIVFLFFNVLNLSACRFEQAIPAPLELDTDALFGDWKAEDGKSRAIISDLRHGRVRLLVKDGQQGMVLDGHIVKLGKQQYLQTHVLALLDENRETLPMPDARWMIWKISVKDKVLTMQETRKLTFDGETREAIVASATRQLVNPKNFGPVRRWKWVGSDKPAKL
jgi:hypothetical protein